MRPRAALCGDERRVRSRTRFQTRKAGRPRHARRLFHAVRADREAGPAFPRAAEGSMWTNWMARTLASHDEADYVIRRARRPALDEVEEAIVPSPSPLAGPSTNAQEGRGEGALAAISRFRKDPPHPPHAPHGSPPSPARGEGLDQRRIAMWG